MKLLQCFVAAFAAVYIVSLFGVPSPLSVLVAVPVSVALLWVWRRAENAL